MDGWVGRCDGLVGRGDEGVEVMDGWVEVEVMDGM